MPELNTIPQVLGINKAKMMAIDTTNATKATAEAITKKKRSESAISLDIVMVFVFQIYLILTIELILFYKLKL